MVSVDERSRKTQISASFGDLPNLRHFILTTVDEILKANKVEGDTQQVGEDIALAAHEVCANVIDHSYGGEGDQPIFATLVVHTAERQIDVTLADHGRGYDPKALEWPPPDSWHVADDPAGRVFVLDQVPEPDIFQERGRGVYLLTLLLDSVKYHPQAGVNYWYLSKHY